MEKLLARLARQLDSLDEASLMNLWSKYATLASRFEPTERWQENVLIFSLIQAKHWKNQLFNYNLAKTCKPADPSIRANQNPSFGFSLENTQTNEENHGTCRVLAFHGRGFEKKKQDDED